MSHDEESASLAEAQSVLHKLWVGSLERMQRDEPVALDKILKPMAGDVTTLNQRQARVLEQVLAKRADQGRENEDLIVDLAKSMDRQTACVGSVPCLVTNSLPYRVKEGRFLNAIERMRLQALYERDYPLIEVYAEKQAGLLKNLAGNAFTCTTCMAAQLALMAAQPEDLRA